MSQSQIRIIQKATVGMKGGVANMPQLAEQLGKMDGNQFDTYRRTWQRHQHIGLMRLRNKQQERMVTRSMLIGYRTVAGMSVDLHLSEHTIRPVLERMLTKGKLHRRGDEYFKL